VTLFNNLIFVLKKLTYKGKLIIQKIIDIKKYHSKVKYIKKITEPFLYLYGLNTLPQLKFISSTN